MQAFTSTITVLVLSSFTCLSAAAQEPERIEFADGEFTITETDDFEKVLAFDGRELARDYMIFFDRVADVGGTEVAFFSVGPGGNACAPSALMVWKPEDGEMTTAALEDECDAPAPAITDYEVFFVPYLLPGETADIRAWNPDEGFRMHGALSYAPEPGTDWASFDPGAVSHPLDLFRNADIYAAARAILGDDLVDVTSGLGTAGEPDVAPDGLVSARGCVPHACGLADTFVVVDRAARKLFFAQQDEPAARFWPERGEWPASAAALIPSDF